MENKDFLAAAEALALQHQNDEMSMAFLKAYRKEDRDDEECLKLADRLIIRLIEINE
ncbi:MAG TPA: hypothetical protein VGB50_00585 [Flavobacterium sp.]|jgi:hypothetical protein